ncbi:hypothetical protein [Conexibacter sp. CPCC 206217]|uniref:hypothetical protein n=1 Tax=Conexibacter sp. CPCC 206217 TaxID=3064574 RepID=UPI00271BBBF9|nr:hypothetical protein [Conexibacter sp. CPCC 206217]MDO8208961.1 hypothetical protein [Conexibacter sp. CPCC 206217]
MPTSGGGRKVPVIFKDTLFAADVKRLGARGRLAMQATRRRLERDGVGQDERAPCQAEHASGTRLPGCVKVYVPARGGAWRIVFQVGRLQDGRLGLVYVAAGVGHLPGGTRRDVYDLAHFRLHGSWPARRQ